MLSEPLLVVARIVSVLDDLERHRFDDARNSHHEIRN
jgi:hypothetical protein